MLPTPVHAQDTGGAGRVPRAYPVRDFFSNPEKAYFRLSADGRTLGFMQPVSVDGAPRRLNVFVQPLKGSQPIGEPRRLTAETARDISIYSWKGSDRILYTSYDTGFPQIYELNVASLTRRQLDVPAETMSFAPRYAPDGRTVVYSLSDAGNTDIYRMDLASGRSIRHLMLPSAGSSAIT